MNWAFIEQRVGALISSLKREVALFFKVLFFKVLCFKLLKSTFTVIAESVGFVVNIVLLIIAVGIDVFCRCFFCCFIRCWLRGAFYFCFRLFPMFSRESV
jgi:hypothetical protein